jgi:putative transport protein
MVRLKAGPIFVSALREHGPVLFLGGVVVTLIPLISGLFFGYWVLKVNPALLVGAIAGAQTMIAGSLPSRKKQTARSRR